MRLSRLEGLFLDNNQLGGDLTTSWKDVAMMRSLRSVDVSNNGFTGSFPSTIFSLPLLQVLAASSNCFSGSLTIGDIVSETIDGKTYSKSTLNTIILNGLSSGTACRNTLRLFPRLIVTPGYVPHEYMAGTIPSALWTFSALTTLSLEGNGFGGTLDTSGLDANASQLQYVNLAYNRLTGAVPDELQLFGGFDYLDLSYNRLSGKLRSDFRFSSVNSGTGVANVLNVSVNRISGPWPTADNDLIATSGFVGNILLGNLFTFNTFAVDAKERGQALLNNGSQQLGVAMIVSSILLVIWAVAFAIAALIKAQWQPAVCAGHRQRESSKIGYFVDEVVEWWNESSHSANARDSMSTTTSGSFVTDNNSANGTLHALELSLRRGASDLELQKLMGTMASLVKCALVISACSFATGLVYVTLKLSPTLKTRFAQYQFQYSWTLSVAYLHRTVPAMVTLIVVLVASVFYVLQNKVIDRSAWDELLVILRGEGELTASSASRSLSLVVSSASLYSWYSWAGWRPSQRTINGLKAVGFMSINVVVMLIMNKYYLQAVLENNSFLIMIQLALAAFKYLWSSAFGNQMKFTWFMMMV